MAVVKQTQKNKVYMCPLCMDEIGPWELHSVLVPQHKENLRRHFHTDCLEWWLDNKEIIPMRNQG